MPDPQTPGFDWRQLLQFLPMVVAGARGGMAGLGGFGEGYSRGAAIHEEQAQVRRAQAAREAAEQYAQQRDVLGDQRYEQDQQRRDAEQQWRILQSIPDLSDEAARAAMASGLEHPDLAVPASEKYLDDAIANLVQSFPHLKLDRTLLRSRAGDVGATTRSAIQRKYLPIYQKATANVTTPEEFDRMMQDPRPLYAGRPFRDLHAMMPPEVQWVPQQEAPEKVNSLEALLARAIAKGDEKEATRIRAEIARNRAPAADATGTWTDTGRVDDKGDSIYINNKTLETRTKPYGKKPTQTGTTNLSPSLQDDIATMKTVENLIDRVVTLGEQTQWAGVGGFAQGSLGEFKSKNLGMGTPESVTLRGYIGQIKGTIAKLRGGTSFTPNEQKLLDTYTPGINESPMSIKAKMDGLREFIRMKRKNQLETALGSGAAIPSHEARGARQALKDRLRGPEVPR